EPALFLVDPRGAGVRVERQTATNREPLGHLALAGADGEELPGGAAALAWLVERATVGLCALQVGVTDRALRMTAAYTAGREQFGRPIASFQAVQQRAADAYVDAEAIRLTTWQAAWRLAADRPPTSGAAITIALLAFWLPAADRFVDWLAPNLPELKLTDHGAVMDAPQPFMLTHPVLGTLLVIDTRRETPSADDLREVPVFVTRTQVVV